MDGNTGMIILYIIMGFFVFVTIVCGTIFWIMWRRRKLIFTNFLSDTGQWERKSWHPDKISAEFDYDNSRYKYDIKKCTRDRINRPVAHYYKGNPEQQIFDFSKGNKKVDIGTMEITGKDFLVMMTSKVIKDIFSDDEVMNWLFIILGAVCLFGIATIIIVLTHNPKEMHLVADNRTTDLLVNAVRKAMGRV